MCLRTWTRSSGPGEAGKSGRWADEGVRPCVSRGGLVHYATSQNTLMAPLGDVSLLNSSV